MLDKMETVAVFAKDMGDYLRTSDLTESKAFIRSFVKEIVVRPQKATIRYTIPTPPDSPIMGGSAEDIALRGKVMNRVLYGGPDGSKLRTFSLTFDLAA